MARIRAGIVGYGRIGKGAEKVIQQNSDFELTAVLTRRSPGELTTDTPSALKVHVDEALNLIGRVDVMILCGGSATDLPMQGPQFAEHFITVDAYGTRAKIPEHFNKMDEISKKAGLVSIISAGWDPGLFSMNRVLAQAVMPYGSGCTFWGKGISHGHSDAIRRVDGVETAVQYTIPIATAVEKARKGRGESLTTRDKHLRECFVVAKPGADKTEIETNIKNMPYYFSDYDTVVHFISRTEFDTNHTGMSHGGIVIHSGKINGSRQTMEFSLDLHNSAEFAASVLVSFARAAHRCHREGRTGALTALDIPVKYLSPKTDEELRKELL